MKDVNQQQLSIIRKTDLRNLIGSQFFSKQDGVARRLCAHAMFADARPSVIKADIEDTRAVGGDGKRPVDVTRFGQFVRQVASVSTS